MAQIRTFSANSLAFPLSESCLDTIRPAQYFCVFSQFLKGWEKKEATLYGEATKEAENSYPESFPATYLVLLMVFRHCSEEKWAFTLNIGSFPRIFRICKGR